MTEAKPSDKQEQAAQLEQEIVSSAAEIIASGEVFPFPGFEEAYIEAAKQTEADYPGLSTPIVELIERLDKDGMTVSQGVHPGSNNIFIVPSGSNNNEDDGTLLRHFRISEKMDERLKKLITMAKEFRTLSQ